MLEIKPIPGFEGYGVSRDGRVWSRWTRGQRVFFIGDGWNCISPSKTNDGYLQVSLRSSPGKYKSVLVHRLVFSAFIGFTHEGFEINHKNGIKHENNLTNLEEISHLDNMRHAEAHGLIKNRPKADKNTSSKLTRSKAKEIRDLYSKGLVSQRELASIFNVSPSLISNIVNLKSWHRAKEAS